MIFQKLKAYWKSKRKRLSPFLFGEAYYKKQILENNLDQIKILALGSSLCARSFNADLIPNSINFGMADQDLYTTHWLFAKYLPHMIKLKKVIYFYGIFTPGHELEKTHQEKTMAIHHYIFGVPYHVNFLKKWHKAYMHRLKGIQRATVTSSYNPPSNNFDTHPANPNGLALAHLKNNNRGTNQTRYLEQIYQLCKTHDIKLYVAIAPVRKDYIQALGDETDEHLFRELFAFTQKEHISVFNKMRDTSFTDTEFFDCDHLNYTGASHFTQLLSDFIKN